eukprot:48283-Amphidinium_carterae.1
MALRSPQSPSSSAPSSSVQFCCQWAPVSLPPSFLFLPDHGRQSSCFDQNYNNPEVAQHRYLVA